MSGEVAITLSIRNPGKKRAIKIGSSISIADHIDIRNGLDDAILSTIYDEIIREQLHQGLKTAPFRKKAE